MSHDRIDRATGLPPLHWTCCSRCSGELFLEKHQLPPGDRMFPVVYCRKCAAVIDAEEAARPFAPGRRAVHRDYPEGPFSDLVITAVDGDRATVMLLGMPDALPEWNWAGWPASMCGRREFARSELRLKGM